MGAGTGEASAGATHVSLPRGYPCERDEGERGANADEDEDIYVAKEQYKPGVGSASDILITSYNYYYTIITDGQQFRHTVVQAVYKCKYMCVSRILNVNIFNLYAETSTCTPLTPEMTPTVETVQFICSLEINVNVRKIRMCI